MKSSKDKLIEAAKDLFAQKGYAAVRTKEIAEIAGVNETTLFRNFKCKKDLYDTVIVSNIKAVDADNFFHRGLTGDVETDLLTIANQIFMLYQTNSKIIKMAMKGIIQDKDSGDNFSAECRGNHIKKHLIEYFKDLKSKNKIDDDPELIAELFMNCMNGYLMSTFILEERRASLTDLKKLTVKIISCINFA